jgi:hypothetical protein
MCVFDLDLIAHECMQKSIEAELNARVNSQTCIRVDQLDLCLIKNSRHHFTFYLKIVELSSLLITFFIYLTKAF